MLTLFSGDSAPRYPPSLRHTGLLKGTPLLFPIYYLLFFFFMTHTIVNHVFCAGRRFSLSRQKIELILIHKSVTHRHNNNIKRSRTHTHDPLSSEAERRTHNPEVGGSKPPGGSTRCGAEASARGS